MERLCCGSWPKGTLLSAWKSSKCWESATDAGTGLTATMAQKDFVSTDQEVNCSLDDDMDIIVSVSKHIGSDGHCTAPYAPSGKADTLILVPSLHTA